MVSSRAKTAVTVVVLTLLMAPAKAPRLFAAEVIDRIVATVNGRIILQSELDEALRYEALLSGRPLSQFTDADRRTVLDRLIDQELLGEQTKEADAQQVLREEAAKRVVEARKLYPEAATEAGWQAVLAGYRLTENDLLDNVQKQLDLMRLVDARLRPSIQIDSKSIEAYYRDKFVPQLEKSGAGEVPLADVSAKIRELLTEQKVNELLVSWLQTLRSESDVHIPGSPQSAAGVEAR